MKKISSGVAVIALSFLVHPVGTLSAEESPRAIVDNYADIAEASTAIPSTRQEN